MPNILVRSVLAVMLALGSAATSSRAADLGTTLASARSSDWHKRQDAYLKIVRSLPTAGAEALSGRKGPDWHGVLIELLGTESRCLSDPHARELGEEYGDYLSGLIETIAGLGDPRAVDALLNEDIVTTGAMATDGLARIGDPAVGPVLRALSQARDAGLRHSLVIVLQTMARKGAVKKPSHKQQIEGALIAAATSEKLPIQIAAVRGLGYLDGTAARAALKHLAGKQGVVGTEAKDALDSKSKNQG